MNIRGHSRGHPRGHSRGRFRGPSRGHALVAHDCGYPLSRYTCRATRVAADFLDFMAFCRCSTGVALHSEGPKGGRRKGGRGRKLSHFSFCCAFRCCVVYSPCFPVWGEEKVMTIYDAGPLAAGPLCGLLIHPLKILVSHLPPPVPGGVAPKFGSEKVSR